MMTPKNIAVALLFPVILAGCAAGAAPPPPPPPQVTAAQVIERDVEQAIPDPSAEIILYCGGGFRSALAAENLVRMGYPNVKSMAGGWREWKAKSLPTE